MRRHYTNQNPLVFFLENPGGHNVSYFEMISRNFVSQRCILQCVLQYILIGPQCIVITTKKENLEEFTMISAVHNIFKTIQPVACLPYVRAPPPIRVSRLQAPKLMSIDFHLRTCVPQAVIKNIEKLECAASNGNRYPPYPQVMATAISQ